MLNEQNSADTTTHKTTTTGNVPKSDLDLGTLLKNVSLNYANSGIVLPWKSHAQAQQLATDYETELQIRLTEGGKRKPLTKQMQNAEKTHDQHLSFVKSYFTEKYGKADVISYYSEFGLDKVGNNYKLPTDKDRRLEALRKLTDALDTHGFTSQVYGKPYWDNLRSEYAALTTAAREKDSLVTSKVSAKNTLKEEGKIFINAMIGLVKALYPNETKAKLREWGFQKEKY
jgi:hypothetical protein